MLRAVTRISRPISVVRPLAVVATRAFSAPQPVKSAQAPAAIGPYSQVRHHHYLCIVVTDE